MLGLVAMTGVLAACTGAPTDDGGASVTPTVGTPAIAQTFDVGGGRMMYLECTGSGSPTVVLVAGQRASADDWMGVAQGVSGDPVFTRVGADTRVCAYDRPGTPVGESPSRSDPVPQPADAASMVADLNALLAAGGIEEPFVIAGHSAGGLVARLYAMTYPDAVSGMVLVDALSEGLQEYMTPEQFAIQLPLLRGDIDASIAEYPALEWVDAPTSFDQVRAAPALRQLPLVVLSSDQPIGPTIPALKEAGVIGQEIPDDFGYVTDAARGKSQADLAALVAGSRFVTDTDSGHDIHREQPELVADAILEVVGLVRAGADRVAE